jgi:Arc/MetJ family transcription regulator
MRMNIEIDDQLLRQAMRSSGMRSKRAAVEAALRLLVKTQSQTASAVSGAKYDGKEI